VTKKKSPSSKFTIEIHHCNFRDLCCFELLFLHFSLEIRESSVVLLEMSRVVLSTSREVNKCNLLANQQSPKLYLLPYSSPTSLLVPEKEGVFFLHPKNLESLFM